MTEPAEKILIVGPAWVGDMVMAQVLFKQLKLRNPACEIHVLAPDWTRPLLDRMPEVAKAIEMPLNHGEFQLLIRRSIGRGLRAEGYTQAILLPNSFKSALVPFFAKIPVRTGWRGEMRYGLLNDVRELDKSKYPLMIQRFAALAFPKGAQLPDQLPKPSLVVQPEQVQQALADFDLNADTPILGLCPGAEYGPAKRWPVEHFASVAKARLQDGYQVWIFGSPKDKPFGEAINELCGGQCVDLTGRTNLAQAIDLNSLVSEVVTNDSGLMHINAALNRPMVAVYGSSSPKFTPPLSHDVTIATLNYPCSPCFERTCPLGHTNCLKTLSPQMVLKALQAQQDVSAPCEVI